MTSPRSMVRVLALAIGVLLALCGCGSAQKGGISTSSSTTSSSTTTPAVDRVAVTRVLRTTVGGEARVTLQVVTEDGHVVMTAIGSDTDTGEEGLVWTTMRQALFVQIGAAMESLGWDQVSAGPDWWQVRYRGGPAAKIATIEPGDPPEDSGTTATTPPEQPTVEPTVAPEPPDPDPASGPADLLALMGRSIDDPVVHGMFMTCRIPQSSGDIDCASDGFRLELDMAKTVVGITLHGDYGSSVWSTYGGDLPLGLTWADTYETVLSKLGEPEARGGGGSQGVMLQYPAGDANVVNIELSTFHDRPDTLAGSTILRIYVYPR